jgi:hypothetical protein
LNKLFASLISVHAVILAGCGGGGSSSGKDAVCSDFSYQEDAQAFFQSHGASQLDGDKDGLACESLPHRSAPSPLPPSPSPPPPPTASAEGLWSGTTASGYALNLVVLENGSLWGVYSINNVAYGVMQGSGSANGSTYAGSGYDYYLTPPTRFAGTFSASFIAKASMNGTVTGSSGTTSFTTAYDSRYDLNPSLADVAGSWNLTAATATGTTVNPVVIASSGTFTGTGPFCSYSGTVLPRSSGKNIYNLTIAFTGSTCEFDGQTLNGIGVLLKQGVTKQLTVAALRSDKSSGFLAMGTK